MTTQNASAKAHAKSMTLLSLFNIPMERDEAQDAPAADSNSKGKIETLCVCQFLDIPSMLNLGCASKGFQQVAKLSGSRRVNHILSKYKVDRREVNYRKVQGWQNQLRYLTTRPLKVQELPEFKWPDDYRGYGRDRIFKFKADILPNGKIAMVCDNFLAVVDPIAGTIKSISNKPDGRFGVHYANSLSYTSGYLVMDAPTMTPGAEDEDGLHIWEGSKDLDSFAYKGLTPFPQSLLPMAYKPFLLDRDSTVLYSSKYVGSTIVVTRFDFITSETTQTTVDLKDYGIIFAAVPPYQLGMNLLLVGEYFLVANSHQPEMDTDVFNPMFAFSFRRSDLGIVDFQMAHQGIHIKREYPNAINADYLLFQTRREDFDQHPRCKKLRVDEEGRITVSDCIIANNFRRTMTNPRLEMLTKRVAIVSDTMYLPNSMYAAECDAVTGKRIRKLIPIHDWLLPGLGQKGLFLGDPERETLMIFTTNNESLFLSTFTLESAEHFFEEDFESKVEEPA